MPNNATHRILLYSSDNAGVGHSSIAIALLNGLRDVSVDCEILVISSTGVPQRFLTRGIEIIKIPSLAPAPPQENQLPYQPRYLQSTSLQKSMQLRQQIIDSVFTSYEPTILLIDHHVTGIGGELTSWLLKKINGYHNFTCAFLCRGIISAPPVIEPPFERANRGIENIELADAFDHFLIFDDSKNLDACSFNLLQMAHLRHKTRCVGKLTVKPRDEMLSRLHVWHRLGLPNKKLILMNVGHGLASQKILASAVEAFQEQQLHHTHVMLVTTTPYMETEELRELQRKYKQEGVRIRSFFDEFLDALLQADLAICRSGYNTISELLLTGCSAIVIPEDYGSGEQTIRARKLPHEGFRVIDPEEVNAESMTTAFQELLSSEKRPPEDLDSTRVARDVMSILTNDDSTLRNTPPVNVAPRTFHG